MNEYGRIANGGLVESRMLAEAPSVDWLPFKPSERPSFNPQTQEVVEIAPLIEPDGITRRWEVLQLAERRPAQNEVFTAPVANDESYVPPQVSRRQFRGALRRVGLFEAVDALRNAPGLDEITRGDVIDFLDAANQIERNHPMITQFAPKLGVTSEQIDDVFRLASTLQ